MGHVCMALVINRILSVSEVNLVSALSVDPKFGISESAPETDTDYFSYLLLEYKNISIICFNFFFTISVV